MKIKSLMTSGFGKFNGPEKWQDFSEGLNVFYGKNEAGKTTVFKMIVGLLYGKPTKKKAYTSFVNTDNDKCNVSAVLEDQGQEVTVYRNFLDDRDSFLGPIEGVNHVPRRTYEDVYALNLQGLRGMNAETWSEIQDLLLSQYSTDTFRTPKAVLEKINLEMRQIKKQTDRGNSILKTLEDKRHQAFLRKKDVQSQLQMAEVLLDKVKVLEGEIEGLKEKKIALLHKKTQVNTFLPILMAKRDQKALKAQLDVFGDLEDLNPHSYDKSKESLKGLYAKMDETSEKVSKYILEKRRLLTLLDQDDLSEMTFNEMFQKHALLSEWALDLKEKENEFKLLQAQYKKAYEQTFEDKFSEDKIEMILSLNYVNLKSLIQEVEDIHEEIKGVKRQKRIQGNERSNTILAMMLILMVASGLAFYFYKDLKIQYLSVFVMGSALMQVVLQLTKRRLNQKSNEALLEDKEGLKKRLRDELRGLSLSSIVEEFMGQEFLGQIIELKHLGERYQALSEALTSKENHYNSQKQAVDVFLRRHTGTVVEGTNPFEDLGKKIEEMKAHKNRIEVINGQTDVLNENLKALEQDLNTLEAWVFEADELLRGLGHGDLLKGVELLKTQESLGGQYQVICQKIDKQPYDEDAYKRFVDAYENAEVQESFDRDHLDVALTVMDETLNEKIIHHGSLKKDWLDLTTANDYNHSLGVLEAIDADIRNHKERYDRLVIMHHLVKEADDLFREKNQPEVFKKAGHYLKMITQGRYTHLEVSEDEASKDKFLIKVDSDKGRMIVDQRFSKGTINQIYLALRLSLIDHLDMEGSKLPICFDELLVEWDHDRLGETVKLLKALSKDRQIILFTCHAWFVDLIKTEDKVKIFEL